jgi:hypothetical protein
MEEFQKLAQRGGLGRGIAQTTFQAGIVGQQMDVFGTLSAQDLQQDGRLDHLAFIVAAFAFAQREIGLDQGGQAQGTIGPGDGQQARVGTGSGRRSRTNGVLCKSGKRADILEKTYRISICNSQAKTRTFGGSELPDWPLGAARGYARRRSSGW